MTQHTNHLGQPIGFPIIDWQSAVFPPRTDKVGRFCRLEFLDADIHGRSLYDAFSKDLNQGNWTYLPYGPFEDFESFDLWLRSICNMDDPLFYAAIDLASEQALGVASYLRIEPESGVIEVGHIHFSPLLQRTTLATEAMFLMMKRVFDELGYRRYEWKCDALNKPSRKAAQRLGFTFEGVFRQATMYKNRNRDTAWFAIIDQDWPTIRSAYEAWLSPENFDPNGKQLKSLAGFMV